MRVILFGLTIVINFIIQTSFLQNIEIIGVKPNTAIIIIVSYAILRGDLEGAIFGFFVGLMQDIFFGRYIGLYALLGMLTGFVCGKPFKDFYPENYLLSFFLVAISIVSYEFIFYFVNFLFRGKVELGLYLRKVIIPEAVYTTILTVPIYPIIYFINAKVEKHESLTRKLF